MANGVEFDICPETGIGCLVINQDSGLLKIDLMPDEAASLEHLLESGDMEAARALLVSVDPRAETEIDDAALQSLAQETGLRAR